MFCNPLEMQVKKYGEQLRYMPWFSYECDLYPWDMCIFGILRALALLFVVDFCVFWRVLFCWVLVFCLFGDKVSWCLGWPGKHNVAEDSLEPSSFYWQLSPGTWGHYSHACFILCWGSNPESVCAWQVLYYMSYIPGRFFENYIAQAILKLSVAKDNLNP